MASIRNGYVSIRNGFELTPKAPKGPWAPSGAEGAVRPAARAQRARRQAAPPGAVRAREALRAREPEKTRNDIMALRVN